MPIQQAQEAGAMMLFGEKYGETVRMITFDNSFSKELCGGCHVKGTGEIGLFKILSEGAIAAGVRRIEACTAQYAEQYVQNFVDEVHASKSFFKSNQGLTKNISDLMDENVKLKKEVERWMLQHAQIIKQSLAKSAEVINDQIVITSLVENLDGKTIKTISYQLEKELGDAIILIGFIENGKANIMLTISEKLVTTKQYHAGNMIKQLALPIQGGGGGQAFFASAGGTVLEGLPEALTSLKAMLQ
jgi:alanyl-tRNA synthetase